MQDVALKRWTIEKSEGRGSAWCDDDDLYKNEFGIK